MPLSSSFVLARADTARAAGTPSWIPGPHGGTNRQRRGRGHNKLTPRRPKPRRRGSGRHALLTTKAPCEQVGRAAGSNRWPGAAMIDSQSVKVSETVTRRDRGYDARKKINAKLHIAVDTIGKCSRSGPPQPGSRRGKPLLGIPRRALIGPPAPQRCDCPGSRTAVTFQGLTPACGTRTLCGIGGHVPRTSRGGSTRARYRRCRSGICLPAEAAV